MSQIKTDGKFAYPNLKKTWFKCCAYQGCLHHEEPLAIKQHLSFCNCAKFYKAGCSFTDYNSYQENGFVEKFYKQVFHPNSSLQ